MKKYIAVFLAALLLIGALAGCGAKSEEETPDTPAETEAPAAVAETRTSDFGVDGSVIFEKDGVTVTTAGLDTDPTSEDAEPIIWVDIENTGAQDAYLGVSSGSVNGLMSMVLLIDFYMENGEYYGGDYDTSLTIPAGSSGRYALGYYGSSVPGINTAVLGEMEVRFTTAEDEYSWPNYTSEPVTITTGETVPAVDITALGTVAIDDDKVTLVVGDQDYDDWFGPEVYLYMQNKSDRFIGIAADGAELDGVLCDYVLGGLVAAPGKVAAAFLSFDGEAKELKGFENLTLNLSFSEAEDMDSLSPTEGTVLDPITVTYPPQIWGEYENGGLRFEVQPKYNDLITVETPKNDADGVLFTVSETASMEAGGFEGAGWLFSLGTVSEEKLHEMLCYDMSGVQVFGKDEDGRYYVYYHPTDVRYARATSEEMERDMDQWSMLCDWAGYVSSGFNDKNGLEYVWYGNTEVDMYLARAAWEDGVNATLSTTEFGPIEIKGVDGTPYAEFVMQGFFYEVDSEETPDGEYVVLNFPDEDVRIDFFFAPGGYARVTAGGYERLYQAMWTDDNISYAEAMQGWYYAVAELAGVKPFDESLVPYYGVWAEKIAGRGQIESAWCVAPGKVEITASWPNSAAEMNTWEIVATLEDGKLVYENGHWELTEFDENGDGWTTDESWEQSGYFYLNAAGELVWHDDQSENGEDSIFVG